MPSVLKTLFASKAVREALRLLAYAALGALGYGQLGCAALPPAQAARVERFNCEVRALEPLVGDVYDAAELLRDTYAGRASIGNVLRGLEVTRLELAELNARMGECSGKAARPELPEGDPS